MIKNNDLVEGEGWFIDEATVMSEEDWEKIKLRIPNQLFHHVDVGKTYEVSFCVDGNETITIGNVTIDKVIAFEHIQKAMEALKNEMMEFIEVYKGFSKCLNEVSVKIDFEELNRQLNCIGEEPKRNGVHHLRQTDFYKRQQNRRWRR